METSTTTLVDDTKPLEPGVTPTNSMEASMIASNNAQPPSQNDQYYRNLKMKYYRSLGVNNGNTVPSSLPNNSGSQLLNERMRTKTVAAPGAKQMIPPNRDIPMSPRKKRSTSTPIPITMPQPIPGLGNRSVLNSDEEEEEEEEDIMLPPEEDFDASSFIPPHEMLARQHHGFAVGTAHSVAVWEQKRRNMMNV